MKEPEAYRDNLEALIAFFGNKLWVNNLFISIALTVVLLAISAVKVHILFKEQK